MMLLITVAVIYCVNANKFVPQIPLFHNIFVLLVIVVQKIYFKKLMNSVTLK